MYPPHWAYERKLSRADRRGFPGSPVVEILRLYCRGWGRWGGVHPGLIPGQETGMKKIKLTGKEQRPGQ